MVVDKKKTFDYFEVIISKKNFKEKMYGKKFFYVKKKISQEKLEKILLLGDKSFIQEEKIARIYPNGELFSHILGQIDDNNNGISGLEKTFDYELTTSRDPLILTLDADLQYLIREELLKSKIYFKTLEVQQY